MEPRHRRRVLRGATDIAAAAMIVAGALLAGISISQHEHRDHALAAQAARKAGVDRAAVAEAEQFRALARSATGHPIGTGHPGGTAKGDRLPTVEAPPFRTAALVLAANRRADKSRPAVRSAARHAAPVRTRPRVATHPGTVSEVGEERGTLVIPALQVRAPIVATGAVDGFLTIPADIHTVGWYDGVDSNAGTTTSAHASWPGQPGVSLLAGHVDWSGEGPGALYYIGQLVAGDPIQVVGSNHETTYWRVSQRPITIAKAELPQDLFDNTGPPKLALVTCGGPFDAATGHYLDNVIVWATPEGR